MRNQHTKLPTCRPRVNAEHHSSRKDALVELMQRDPFCQLGLATFEVIEFRTSQHDPAFAPFADDGTG